MLPSHTQPLQFTCITHVQNPLKSVLAVSGHPRGVALGADVGQRVTSGAVGTLHTPGQRGPEDRCGGLSVTRICTEKLYSCTQGS